MFEPGRRGRLNFLWEPMAAGKGGAENMAATVLMRVIQDCICSALLVVKCKHRSTRGQQNKRIQWMEQKMSTFYLLNETVHFVFNTTDTVLKTEQLAGSC